ncbi:hypothetical protein AVEN_76128-1 [Araneus ventricosus]|uniref:Secreted protein n=1 Tax=Araneus ventricosus TaxID=182803 RepID=A0A4Y2IH70_ARAVE|nr:hypothetical protein AVEN_76128-1 [Araneus ventricosus]
MCSPGWQVTLNRELPHHWTRTLVWMMFLHAALRVARSHAMQFLPVGYVKDKAYISPIPNTRKHCRKPNLSTWIVARATDHNAKPLQNENDSPFTRDQLSHQKEIPNLKKSRVESGQREVLKLWNMRAMCFMMITKVEI